MSIPHDDPLLIDYVHLLLHSYRRWTGRELIPASLSPERSDEALFHAPFVVLSHGTQEDPILNYGNQAALDLWEMTWEKFTSMPSRLTAEPINREKRANFLAEVTCHGYTDAYRGVRISSSGRRFLIEQATVWNIVDVEGHYLGQAATFSRWKYL